MEREEEKRAQRLVIKKDRMLAKNSADKFRLKIKGGRRRAAAKTKKMRRKETVPKMVVLKDKTPTDHPNREVWRKKEVSGQQIVEIRARNESVCLALGRLLKTSNRCYGTDGNTARDCHF